MFAHLRLKWKIAHLLSPRLHICCWCIFSDLHICWRRVCTFVVVCTFAGVMFAHLLALHPTPPPPPPSGFQPVSFHLRFITHFWKQVTTRATCDVEMITTPPTRATVTPNAMITATVAETTITIAAEVNSDENANNDNRYNDNKIINNGFSYMMMVMI